MVADAVAQRPPGRASARGVGRPLAAVLVPIVLVLAGHFITKAVKEREVRLKETEVDLQWVRAALAILGDESEEVVPMRRWGIDVVNHFSPVKIDPEAEMNLLLKKTTMSSPTYVMPPEIRASMQARLEFTARLREKYGPLVRGLPIHDRTVSVGESGAHVFFIPHVPGRIAEAISMEGGPSGHFQSGSVQTAVDWSRKEDDGYIAEIAEALAQLTRREFERRGWSNLG